MKTLPLLTLLAFAAASAAGLTVVTQKAEAQPTDPIKSSNDQLIVAELFTSQSCSSCPPAEALFAKLAEEENLLTMEWHVDYWDDLIHHGSRWKDRYSDRAYTARQRAYNRSLRGTGGVYTPQAIVNGDYEGVGNRRSEVAEIIGFAKDLNLPEQHETDVKGGENKGRKLSGKNIVLEAEILGQTGKNPMEPQPRCRARARRREMRVKPASLRT